MCSEVYDQLVNAGVIIPQPEKEPPTVPMDYKWAQELGLIRKPASFMTSICDERGEELLYAGMPISDVFKVSVCVRVCVCCNISTYRNYLNVIHVHVYIQGTSAYFVFFAAHIATYVYTCRHI